MKIDRICVRKLFDIYDYDIDLSQENVKIFTGPNGYGKTTVLTMLSALEKSDFLYFFRFPFEGIGIYFDNGDALTVIQRHLNEHSDNATGISSYNPKGVEIIFRYTRNRVKENKVVEYVLSIDRIVGALLNSRYIIDIDGLDANEMIDVLSAYVQKQGGVYESIASEQGQKQFMLLISYFKVRFIPAQRISFTQKDDGNRNLPLRYRSQFRKVSSIDEVVNSLKDMLDEKRLEYLNAAQAHNNQFMRRLMSPNGQGVYSKEEYDKKAAPLKKQIAELSSFNMIKDVDVFEYDDKRKDDLSLYIDDVAENIKTYDSIIGKLRIFSEIVKEKEFSDKTIVFSPDDGLVIKSSSGRELNANMLSSGEQNEIIMLYHLIFDVADGGVLLVDEPEISLHVAWQLDFLTDAKKIAMEKNLQVIIATHSPQIINEDWERCFDFYKNRIMHND